MQFVNETEFGSKFDTQSKEVGFVFMLIEVTINNKVQSFSDCITNFFYNDNCALDILKC